MIRALSTFTPVEQRAILALVEAADRATQVAGVHDTTVMRAEGVIDLHPGEPPARVIGADGKSYPAS
jgi:hypothetical protein